MLHSIQDLPLHLQRGHGVALKRHRHGDQFLDRLPVPEGIHIGAEQVYLNGVLLVRGTDYTASNGSSITGLTALAASDILEIITFTAFDLATSISNALFDAKGDILVATAADTPGKLTVGVDGYVLTADSSTATGLKWAAGLPSQTGNSGKYLTTDGSAASWGAITTDPTPTVFMLGGM